MYQIEGGIFMLKEKEKMRLPHRWQLCLMIFSTILSWG